MKLFLRHLVKLSTLVLVLASFGHTALAAPLELSLDDSIALALKNNSDIKLADSAREKSLWTIKQAEAGKGFNLSFTHTDKRYNYFQSSALYLHGLYIYDVGNKFDNLLTLSLPIYTGGKLESQIDSAKLNFQVADLNIAATKQQLKQTVTNGYFNVLQARNNLQVSQQTVDTYARHLKNVQLQFDAGVVAKSDVLASETSLANAQVNLIKTKNSHALAIANLNNAIGLPLNTEITLKEDLKHDEDPRTLEDCEKYALANRPEMAQYQAKVGIARENLTSAKSGYLPTVSMSATQDWYDSEFPGNDHGTWSVGLTASFSVFDAGLNRSKVKQAQADIVSAQEQARQKSDAILLEVRQCFLSMREAEKRIEASQVAVNQAEENLRIAELRYGAGVGTNLDVLDAVLSMNTAKTSNIQALYDYNTNKTSLEKAMGIALK